ncbi:MAG TPA: polysaccharide deacetylase family protein, partial [Gemmatimonadaceae bacterium]|nr:polysaccharide deacetylase family protein [Gemmatimonadaceae bacterium]
HPNRSTISEVPMRSLRWLLVTLLFVASSLPAQTKTVAERLGYPRDAKLLILHADDAGFAHSADAAIFDALDRGLVSSASIMMPTPWVTEVAAYAKAHPEADLGLHLTLTSEWQTYRWGSVASSDKVPSLLDADGTFPNNDSVVAVRAKQEEIEIELRAQIQRAIAMGIHPTHLDSHMGSLFTTPALLAAYVKIAHEYHLPFLALRNGNPFGDATMPLTPNDIPLDALIQAFPNVTPDKWKAFYLNAIANLKPGLTEIIVHLGHDDAELQAVTVNNVPWGSAWRQRDYDVVNSPEFRKALQDNKVILIKWRDLQKLVQP